MHLFDQPAPHRAGRRSVQRSGDLDVSLANGLESRTVVEARRPLPVRFGPELEIRLGNAFDVAWLGVAGTVPDVEFGDRRAQQVRHEVQVAEHGLAELLGSADLVAGPVEGKAPAERVIRLPDVVVELPLEPLEGRERAVVVIEEQVVRSDLVPLARAVVVVAVLLLLLLELALVASKAGSDLLLLALRHHSFRAGVVRS